MTYTVLCESNYCINQRTLQKEYEFILVYLLIEAAKKVIFLVARTIRPYPTPLSLVVTFFFRFFVRAQKKVIFS